MIFIRLMFTLCLLLALAACCSTGMGKIPAPAPAAVPSDWEKMAPEPKGMRIPVKGERSEP